MSRLREKTTATLLIAIFMISTMTFAVSVMAQKDKDYVTIQDGTLTYLAGHYLDDQPLQVGYDIFGYNYQGHMFKGTYANSYLGKDGFPPYEGDADAYVTANPTVVSKWYWPYRDVKLAMKWSDVWISNVDRNDDGKLDRGDAEPYTSSAAPGAWLTNHQSGEYDLNGDTIKWNYFVKIVFPGDDAYLDEEEGVWYTEEGGTEIGPSLWSAYAIIQQIENDPGQDLHGPQYISPYSAGLGYYNP